MVSFQVYCEVYFDIYKEMKKKKTYGGISTKISWDFPHKMIVVRS